MQGLPSPSVIEGIMKGHCYTHRMLCLGDGLQLSEIHLEMDRAARRKLGTSSGQNMCLDSTLAESICTGDRRVEVGVPLGLGSH